MTDFFSGSKPDLISMKSMNDLVDIVVEGGNASGIVKQGSDNINNLEQFIKNSSKPSPFDLKSIYQNYIKPNLLPLIIIVVFIGFFLFRYYSVKEEKFNPAEPVDTQINRNSYVDINLPVLYEVEQINKLSEEEMINKMKKKSKQFESSPPQINSCQIAGDSGDEREEVIYGSNSWLNQQDGIPNPFFGNDYVTTTGDAINYASEKNKKSLDLAANMIFN
jgi:hypothetical protein